MIDTFLLARMQFAANITFHILFPAITIALCWCLLFFKIRYNKTGNQNWISLYKFWVKVFALCFALGVVSGITMSFQFGTNWPGFMEKVGNIAGPLLAYEVLTAFFLEATFLGIMLFGASRVSNFVHTLSTLLVAIGTTISAFWILVLDSWMQTPAGFEVIEGIIHPTNWFEVIFNPSTVYRLSHMLIASFLTCAFFIAGISAYKLLKKVDVAEASLGIKFGMYLALALVPLQILVGDLHGLNTLKYQGAKVAAMEGIWETEKGADLRLFAIIDEKNKQNKMEVKIPKLASIILAHSAEGEIKGINSYEESPPVAAMFYGFRIMVGIGMIMLATAIVGFFYVRKNKIPKWFLKTLVCLTFSGWVATVAGWYVTEIGRQPYLVYGVLKTKDALATNVSANMIASSLTMYLVLYAFLTTAFLSVLFYMAKPKKS